MRGLAAIFRKELADHFASWRFLILYALICLAGAASVYGAGQTIRSELSGYDTPPFAFLFLFTQAGGWVPFPFLTFIMFLGPLVGLALAFDTINGERNRGTMSRLMAQPIYRDAVINGKFLAGLTTVSVMLTSIVVIVSGLGVAMIGLIPTPEEVIRVFAFLVLCILYVAFWMALSTLFSVLVRQTATSALAGIAAWIFVTFFMTLVTNALAGGLINSFFPSTIDSIEGYIDVVGVQQTIANLSPNMLFADASQAILFPNLRTLNPLMQALIGEMPGTLPTPLPVSESLALIWPQAVGLLALSAICFAIAYTKFMTEEIRAL